MLVKIDKKETNARPTREEAEESVRTLLAYLGEDVTRPGLIETPARVVRAWEEWCDGYKEDAADLVGKFFDDIQGYDQPVIMRNIDFVSHCEHHMASMPGTAHVAYWPDKKVVGISKLARVVDVFAKRLQSQETMTKQIAESLHNGLSPKGVAVIIEAEHACMTTRGANKADAHLVTQFFTGCFKTDLQAQERITALLCGAPRHK
ncbi:MAG: GTP cyclohydrolase I [Alphaproteobacteria bacterium]|nr:GTP cyclohydrolase I [Alphaproteobacteria bacterium]